MHRWEIKKLASHQSQPQHALRSGENAGDRAGTITSVLSTPEGMLGLALVRRQFLDLPSMQGPADQAVILATPAAFQAPAS